MASSPTPPAHRTEGFNPLCGDEVVVFLDVEDGVVKDLRIAGQGCSISQSSASMMSTAVKGKTVAEARDVDPGVQGDDVDPRARRSTARTARDENVVDVKLGDLEALRGVVKFPVRIKCATLAWNTLTLGLEELSA